VVPNPFYQIYEGAALLAGAEPQYLNTLPSHNFERLTDFGGYPVWLPDSRQLMFVSGGHDFYILDTLSKNVRKVFSVPRDIIGPPQLTRDGRQAYFSRRVTDGDIWLLTLHASKPAR